MQVWYVLSMFFNILKLEFIFLLFGGGREEKGGGGWISAVTAI